MRRTHSLSLKPLFTFNTLLFTPFHSIQSNLSWKLNLSSKGHTCQEWKWRSLCSTLSSSPTHHHVCPKERNWGPSIIKLALFFLYFSFFYGAWEWNFIYRRYSANWTDEWHYLHSLIHRANLVSYCVSVTVICMKWQKAILNIF